MKKENAGLKPRVYALIAVGIAAALCAMFINQFLFTQKSAEFSPNDKIESVQDSLAGRLPKVESLIKSTMISSGMPGLSVAIVHGDQTIYQSGFGFANLEAGTKITANTLFQIGSNSKAFTALAVLQLQQEGLLSVTDPITKYIPWLKFYYKGVEAQVTVQQFLHHTSGVSANTIASIPQLSGPQALEQTVRILAGTELAHRPGERYEYATIGYDVLGLLIEKITGGSYEDYMQQNILQPLNLANTKMYQNNIQPDIYATGYKLRFLAPAAYQAPEYGGNKPAGYILSSAGDMAKWLKIQMDSVDTGFNGSLIQESHAPNTSAAPFGKEMYYANGWIVYDNHGTEIFHSGSNPNFSSYIAFRPSEKIGVAVLCNINSVNTSYIGEGVMNILLQKPQGAAMQDARGFFDLVCSFIIIALLFFIARAAYVLLARMLRIKREQNPSCAVRASKLAASTAIAVSIGAAVCFLPCLLLGQPWSFLFVWYPFTVEYMVVLAYVSIALSYCNALPNCFKPAHK